MAKRIGKYKISNKESLLSLADGGKIDGSASVTGNLTVTGDVTQHMKVAVASGSSTSTNAFSGNAGTLTEAAHAGRTVLMPDATVDATLALPTPSKAGISYHLVYNGVADDGQDMVISFSDDACYFKGNLMTHDEDEAGATQVSTIFANGSSNDVLTLNDPHAYDIHMVSLSTTVMAIWGWVVSDTVAAFSDAD